MKKITIHTDGACKGNPGPGGWGFVLQFNDNDTVQTYSGGELETTNNRMELMAAIQALRELSEPCEVALYTDSTYVQKGISEWISNWKKNNWRNSKRQPVKNSDLWKELDLETERHKIGWHWVKAHCGNKFNELADSLANEGVETVLRDSTV